MVSLPRRPLQRLSEALAWRVRRLVGDQSLDRAIVHLAQAWRPRLRQPVFIGIAGSAGKTTTKELLHGVLSYRQRGLANPSSLNALPEVAKVVLRLRPGHDFCIAELSEDKPGIMDAPLALLRPSIGVVTVIGNDHWSAFGSREDIANEVGKLVAALPAGGTAVLNADDQAVLAMANECAAKVLTYGRSTSAMLRAEDVHSVWPDRLQMTLRWGAERATVRTQLCGAHWVPAVLGAIGGGLAAGMSLADCVEGIARVYPFEGRMQPVPTAQGVTFIRDDFKAPLWSVDACFEFMRSAQAKRKFIVLGEISDVSSSKGAALAKLAARAQTIADVTVLVGPWACSALRARRPGQDDALKAYNRVREAADYLQSTLRQGDLVLIKGTAKKDHLLRIILARDGGMACWREDCGRDQFCDACPDRTKASGAPAQAGGATAPRATRIPDSSRLNDATQVVVGMGNPEKQYAGTPHNVGYDLVDQMATALGLAWMETTDAWIAHGMDRNQAVCLVKIRGPMNLIGAGLRQVSENLGFTPAQTILVYDDLALPLGTVRARLSGGAGGHRGVASVLEAFQTDAFRRVKVGIGQAEARVPPASYVLTPWDAAIRPAVHRAIQAGIARLDELLPRPPDRHGLAPTPENERAPHGQE